MTSVWSRVHQKERRHQILAAYREVARGCFANRGDWIGGEPVPEQRQRFYAALAFLAGNEEDRMLGNAILHSGLKRAPSGHFSGSTATMLLVRHAAQLTPSNQRSLKLLLRKQKSDCLTRDFRFHGYNDNTPAMATYHLLVGGELLQDKRMIEEGVANLLEYRQMFRRRGCDSEYVSPTYTPITVLMMSEIVNHSSHPKARRLASGLETRLWAELCAHWHPETGRLAGPSGRSYRMDSDGFLSISSMLFYVVFGEAAFINPLAQESPAYVGTLCPEGVTASLPRTTACWIASGDYHVPDAFAELVLEKRYPYRIHTTAECGHSGNGRFKAVQEPHETKERWVYIPGTYHCPSTHQVLSTYMEEDFSIGTASGPFTSGVQSECFFLSYRRKCGERCQANTGTFYTRYVINDRRPGQENDYFVTRKEKHVVGDGLLYNQGFCTTLHHDRTTVVLTRPYPDEAWKVRSLKYSILTNLTYSKPDEIWVGEQPVRQFQAKSKNLDTVILRCGRVWVAFRPLMGRQLEVESRLLVDRENEYGVISFFNYQGCARKFSVDDFPGFVNGFICEVSTVDQHPTFQSFRKYVDDCDLVFDMSMEVVTLRYLRKETELAMVWDPFCFSTKFATVNGRPRPEPLFEADGIDASSLPFLEDKDRNSCKENSEWATRVHTRPIPYYFSDNS